MQVTLTEVRPDGTERYVQNGWLRLSHRKLDPARSTRSTRSTRTRPHDMQPLTPGELTEAQVALFPFAHQFRAGSRIRLTIAGARRRPAEWAFDTPATNGAGREPVAHDATHLSRLVLPVLPNGPGPRRRARRRARRCGPSRAAPTWHRAAP